MARFAGSIHFQRPSEGTLTVSTQLLGALLGLYTMPRWAVQSVMGISLFSKVCEDGVKPNES